MLQHKPNERTRRKVGFFVSAQKCLMINTCDFYEVLIIKNLNVNSNSTAVDLRKVLDYNLFQM